jgi:methyltransferase
MPPSWSRASTCWALGVLVALLAAQRSLELWISARHTRALKVRGAVEHGRGHFPIFVALHVAFPLALVAEVVYGSMRPGPWAPFWFLLFLGAELLRYASIRALGEYWNVRIWVVPGMQPVRSGPYRFLRHPNYLAVATELPALAMFFGAWRTAVGFSALNLAALAVRIPVEERALSGAAGPEQTERAAFPRARSDPPPHP